MIYFDNNSTTVPYPEVVSVITNSLTRYYANPFTQYEIGKKTNQAMEDSRTRLKRMLGIKKKETLLFTASATESNNMAIRGRVSLFSSSCKTPHVIISSIEHSSVYQTCLDLQKKNHCSLSIIPTDCQGRINLEKLSYEIKKNEPYIAIICIILANNEIGVLQDLDAITNLCKGFFLHIDATQYIGKYPVRVSSWGVQSMTFGSHKFHGPRLGALYLQDHYQIQNCCSMGGKSEYGLRAGTPNVAYILGMEKALAISMKNHKNKKKHVMGMCHYLEENMKKICNVRVNSGSVKRLYNTLSVVLPIQNSQQLVQYLNQYNICVNVGSACNMGKRSRILDALGLTPQEQNSTLRISLCCSNTRKECDQFLSVLQKFFEKKKF